MTWGRFCITLVSHANDLADEANALEREVAADREAQMLYAEVVGRPVWQYVDTAPAAHLAELRERWRVLAWAINTPQPE